MLRILLTLLLDGTCEAIWLRGRWRGDVAVRLGRIWLRRWRILLQRILSVHYRAIRISYCAPASLECSLQALRRMFRGCTLEQPEPVVAAAAAVAAAVAAAGKGEEEAGPIVVADTAELAVAVL